MNEKQNEKQNEKRVDDALEKRQHMGRTYKCRIKEIGLRKDRLNRDCVHLYRPDRYGETKQYLYRVRDGCRRVGLLRRKCRAIERGTAPVDSDCADEFHRKLKKGEQDMENVTAEVMDLLSTLPDERQQMVMKKRYLKGRRWKEIAAEMELAESEVLAYHQKALPILKRKLKNASVIC